MDPWINILLPFMLLLARISGFFAVLPVFSWGSLPIRVRVGITFVVTIFFAAITPRYPTAGGVHWVAASVLLGKEVLCGLALGFVVRLLFLSLQLGGRMIERQMGFALAQIIDPMTGEQAETVGVFFETTFTLLFLVAGGHRLLLLLIARSYDVFPVGMTPDSQVMAEGVVEAGSAMLLFALQLVAPLLAAFMVLSVILAILARVLPEMDILLGSLPLRVGLGFFMAAAIMPLMSSVISQIANWMQRMLVT